MKYHDILDIYVTATPEQIDEAYTKKLAVLNCSDASPSIKQRKEAELSKAREDCLEYRSKRFGEKCAMEIADAGRTALEPNRMNDCCSDCTGCCSCICWGIVCTVILGVVLDIVKKYTEKMRIEAEEAQKIAERERARKRAEELNTLIKSKDETVKRCTEKRGELAANLNHRQLRLQAQEKIFEEKRQSIIAFCKKIGLNITEMQISNSPAVAALRRNVTAAKEEVAAANRAITANEELISSSMAEAERARNELYNR